MHFVHLFLQLQLEPGVEEVGPADRHGPVIVGLGVRLFDLGWAGGEPDSAGRLVLSLSASVCVSYDVQTVRTFIFKNDLVAVEYMFKL